MNLFDLSDNSKIWIYQSNRAFNQKEIDWLNTFLGAFTADWKAHGTPLKASFEVAYNQVIMLAVEEEVGAASGCSIDTSVHAIQEIEQHLGVQLFARLNIPLLIDGKIELCDRVTLIDKFNKQLVDENTLVLDNTITHLGTWREAWIKPIKDTWAKNWIPLISEKQES